MKRFGWSVLLLLAGAGLCAQAPRIIIPPKRPPLILLRCDLEVVSLAVEPAEATAGSAVELRAVLRNRGPAAAPAFTIDLLVDGQAVMRQTAAPLAAGASVHRSFPFTAPAAVGRHSFSCRLDAGGRVAEENEGNNEKAAVFTVNPAAAPDLRIVAMSLDPPQVTMQTSFVVVVTVANRGTSPAVFPADSFIITGDFIVAHTGTGETFQPGEERTYRLRKQAFIQEGDFAWTCKVDPDNQVRESDENNNSFTLRGRIEPAPPSLCDLVVTKVSFSPEHPTPLDAVTITVEMQNIGSEAAVLPEGMSWWQAVSPEGAGRLASGMFEKIVAPGEVFTNSGLLLSPGRLNPGTYAFAVSVDPQKRCREANEENNTLSIPLILQGEGAPDMVIRDMHLDPPQVTMQTSFVVVVTAANRGSSVAVFPADSFIITGDFIVAHTGTGETFQPGEERTYRLRKQAFIQEGEFAWTCKVDPDNHVRESDEGNNSFTLRGRIEPSPPSLCDLVVTKVSFSPEHPTPLDAVTITVEMQNIGSEAAVLPEGMSWWQAVSPEGAGRLASGMFEKIVAPGEVFTNSGLLLSPGRLNPGTYTFAVSVDPLKRCREANEENNGTSVVLAVAEAN